MWSSYISLMDGQMKKTKRQNTTQITQAEPLEPHYNKNEVR